MKLNFDSRKKLGNFLSSKTFTQFRGRECLPLVELVVERAWPLINKGKLAKFNKDTVRYVLNTN